MSITIDTVLSYAEVVRAVQANEKVTLLRKDGTRIAGTLRHITPAQDNPCFLPAGGDLRTAWVRITTTMGFEIWVPFLELVELRGERMVAWEIYPE